VLFTLNFNTVNYLLTDKLVASGTILFTYGVIFRKI